MKVSLRRAVASDANLLFALAPGPDGQPDARIAFIREAIELESLIAFLAEDDSQRVLGEITLRVRERRLAEISLVVAPDARDRGVAWGLTAMAIAWADGSGIDVMLVAVAKSTPGARELYERLEFMMVDEKPDALIMKRLRPGAPVHIRE